jgi:hypothetical protein
MSQIHFIGGEKGGVGKSVVARVLAQYFIDKQRPFVGLDADVSHGALIRHYGDATKSVDLSSSESTDQIFTLAAEGAERVLVDLPAQSDQALARWINEAGIFQLAQESSVQLVFWHVMDDGKDAVSTLDRLLERYAGKAAFVVVTNLGRGKDFSLFDGSPVRAKAEAAGAAFFSLAELHPAAMKKIDRLDVSFWAAINNLNLGADVLTRMDRQRIKVWLQTTYEQLDKLPVLS